MDDSSAKDGKTFPQGNENVSETNRSRRTVRAIFVFAALGLLAMLENILSATLGYRWLIVICVVYVVVVGAAAIRWTYGPRMLLRRLWPTLCLTSAVTTAVAVTFMSGFWEIAGTIIAAALMTGAVLMATNLYSVARFLWVAAIIAGALACIGFGVKRLVSGDTFGAEIIGVGAACAAGGLAWHFGHATAVGIVNVGLGAMAIGLGGTRLMDEHMLLGAAIIAYGVAFTAEGVARLLGRAVLFHAAVLGLGGGCFALGVAFLASHREVFGALFIGAGLVQIGLVISLLAGRAVLFGAVILGLTGVCFAFAWAWLTNGKILLGAACIGTGAATIAFGVMAVGINQATVKFYLQRLHAALRSETIVSHDSGQHQVK